MVNRRSTRKAGFVSRLWSFPNSLLRSSGYATNTATRAVGRVARNVTGGVANTGRALAHGLNRGVNGLVTGTRRKNRKNRKNRSNRNRSNRNRRN